MDQQEEKGTTTRGRKPTGRMRSAEYVSWANTTWEAIDELQRELGDEYTRSATTELLVLAALRQLGREPAQENLQRFRR